MIQFLHNNQQGAETPVHDLLLVSFKFQVQCVDFITHLILCVGLLLEQVK